MTREQRENKRAADRVSRKARYARRKADGQCVRCGGTPEPDCVQCRACMDEVNAGNADRDSSRQARRREKLRRACRCEDCGARAEAPVGVIRGARDVEARRLCLEHRLKKAEARRTGTSTRRCSVCRGVGHTRTTCRQRYEQTPSQLPTSTGLGNWSW